MRAKVFFLPLIVLIFCASTALAAEKSQLMVHYFYTPSCPLCTPTTQVVDKAEKTFGNKILIVRHNYAESQDTFNAMSLALDHYNMAEETPSLVIFAGDKCLGGGEEIQNKLISTIDSLLNSGVITPDFSQFGAASDEKLRELYANKSSLWIVLAAGFADGFNPCAFATVILFVSMLSGIGRSRNTILAVGVSFITGVFLTYFVLGAAFFEIMGYFEGSSNLKFLGLAIKWISLAMVLVAGVLSLIDAWRGWRSDGKEKMLLVLPEGLKNRIRKRLRATAHGGSLIIGAFISGVIISFLEAACTGQTYMPTIAMIVSDNTTAAKGYWLLFLYNILFIIPLLAVFIAVFLGMTSDQIANAARKRVWATKLALAAVFLAIAAWLGMALLPTLYSSDTTGESNTEVHIEKPQDTTEDEHIDR